jgi:hypothetical protein
MVQKSERESLILLLELRGVLMDPEIDDFELDYRKLLLKEVEDRLYLMHLGDYVLP